MFNDKSCLACCWCLFSGSVDRSMIKIKYAHFFFSVTKQKLILKLLNVLLVVYLIISTVLNC